MERSDPAGVVELAGWSTNGYLLVGERITAIDPGAPCVARRMVAHVTEQLGRPASDIAWVAVTHYHVDHVAGLPELVKLTGCRVALPAGAMAHIRDGKPLQFPPARRWPFMITGNKHTRNPMPSLRDLREMARIGLPFGNQTLPVEVDAWLDEGDQLPGAPGWTVLHTPGHTFDSLCFWHEPSGSLIAGDTVLGSHLIGPRANPFYISRTTTIATLQRLADLPVQRLYTAHGRNFTGENLLVGVADTLEP